MPRISEPPERLASPSIDPEEVARFSAIADEWWDPHGKFRPLHQIGPLRLTYIRDTLAARFGRDASADRPLDGLRILDIGCGGGLISEPLARMGADVTGVDASERNIKTAKTHAERMGVAVDYRHGTAELLAEAGESFDAVLNMEVVEHVADAGEFLAVCAGMVRPGGLTIVSTINRTPKAFALAIVGAEYVLRWLPRGTHQFDKLVKPAEIEAALSAAGLAPEPPVGVVYSPLTGRWSLSPDVSVNYMLAATRPAGA